jgi:quercetin dioxygenase-like cupin family protein
MAYRFMASWEAQEIAMAFQFYRSEAKSCPVVNIPNLGLELAVRMAPDVSGNELAILETVNAPGFGPPLHRHPETEVFRVQEGRYLYEVNGQRFEATVGDVVSVPGGAAHTFLNISDQPSRQIVLMLPAMDALGFFTGLGTVLEHGNPGLDALNAFGKPWRVEFLGGPLKR